MLGGINLLAVLNDAKKEFFPLLLRAHQNALIRFPNLCFFCYWWMMSNHPFEHLDQT